MRKENLLEIMRNIAYYYHLIVQYENDQIVIKLPYTNYNVVVYRLQENGMIRSDDKKKWLLKFPRHDNDIRFVKTITRHIEKNINKYPISDKERRVIYHMYVRNIAQRINVKFTPNTLIISDSALQSSRIIVNRKTMNVISLEGVVNIKQLKKMIEWLAYFDFCLDIVNN